MAMVAVAVGHDGAVRLIEVGFALAFFAIFMGALRSLARPGDEYQDMMLHLHEIRLQSAAPSSRGSEDLLKYFAGVSFCCLVIPLSPLK